MEEERDNFNEWLEDFRKEHPDAYSRIVANLTSIDDYGDVQLLFDGYWIHFYRRPAKPQNVTGKYLFFSQADLLLYKLAIDELRNNEFFSAKVNSWLLGANTEYVLCIYYKNDSRKNELADRYRGRPNLKYRYWKTDDATRKGIYSEEFLGKLDEKTSSDFTNKRSHS